MKMTKITEFYYFISSKIEEIPTIAAKYIYGYGCMSYFLEQSKDTFFYEFSWFALHIPSPSPTPTLLYRRHCPCTLQIRFQEIKMYVQQPNVPTTTILTMTPDHMYMKGSTGTLFIHP